MALQLPTDTAHVQFETRQYELMNRPLGQGIPRRKLYLGAVAFAVWFVVMLIVGVSPLSSLGPMLYLVPPFAFVFLGTRVGDDGRMTFLRWYDAVLAWQPSRRRVIGNPLLSPDYTARTATPLDIDSAIVEIDPGVPTPNDDTAPAAANPGRPHHGRRPRGRLHGRRTAPTGQPNGRGL